MRKLTSIFLIVSCLLLFASLIGCGEKQENMRFYYNPAWTKSGDVIFITGLQSARTDALGSALGSTYTESLTTMTSAGLSDAFIVDVTSDPAYKLTCAPTGEYVAYMGTLRNGLYGKITVRNISTTSPHKGLETIELNFSPGIKAFDWSNDGTKLVYCTTQEVRTILVGGGSDTLVTAAASIEFVSWQNGNRIAYITDNGTNKILSLIYSDGSGNVNLSAGGSVDKPQISSANTNEVFGIAGGAYCKVNVAAVSPATSEVLASFGGEVPRLSAAADKVVYSKTGERSGVYILTLATSTEAKIK